MKPQEGFPAGNCFQRGVSEPLVSGERHDRVTRLVLADQLRVAESAQLDHVREWRDQLRPATGLPDLESRPERVRACGKRSEEHTSELLSLMRNSYAVFSLKKKK